MDAPEEAHRRSRSGEREIPDWLRGHGVVAAPCTCSGRRRRGDHVAATLDAGARSVRRAFFTDDIAAQPGLLQGIDPRVKLATTVGLLMIVALVHQVVLLVVVYLVVLLVAAASRVPLATFLGRSWLSVLLFTGLVTLPATLNLITPGPTAVPLGTWFSHDVAITTTGLQVALTLILRVALSVSITALLALTTSWNHMLAALRGLGLPRIFVLVTGLAYRYVFLLSGIVSDQYEARRARTPRSDNRTRSGRQSVAASAGALFGHTHALADEVYQAMIARGWTGHARTLERAPLDAHDAVWIASCSLVGVVVLSAGHVLG